jgi:hypothetical protein
MCGWPSTAQRILARYFGLQFYLEDLLGGQWTA